MDAGLVDALLQPGHLVLAAQIVVGVGLAGWFAFPFLHRKSLLNGSGKVMRMIIAEENQKQTKISEERFKTLLKDTIEAHERVEEEKLKAALLAHRLAEYEGNEP